MASTAFQKRGEVILPFPVGGSIGIPSFSFSIINGNGLQKPEVEELAAEEEPIIFRPEISDTDIGSVILKPFTGGGIAGNVVREFYRVPGAGDVRGNASSTNHNAPYISLLAKNAIASAPINYPGAIAGMYPQKVLFFRGPSSYPVPLVSQEVEFTRLYPQKEVYDSASPYGGENPARGYSFPNNRVPAGGTLGVNIPQFYHRRASKPSPREATVYEPKVSHIGFSLPIGSERAMPEGDSSIRYFGARDEAQIIQSTEIMTPLTSTQERGRLLEPTIEPGPTLPPISINEASPSEEFSLPTTTSQSTEYRSEVPLILRTSDQTSGIPSYSTRAVSVIPGTTSTESNRDLPQRVTLTELVENNVPKVMEIKVAFQRPGFTEEKLRYQQRDYRRAEARHPDRLPPEYNQKRSHGGQLPIVTQTMRAEIQERRYSAISANARSDNAWTTSHYEATMTGRHFTDTPYSAHQANLGDGHSNHYFRLDMNLHPSQENYTTGSFEPPQPYSLKEGFHPERDPFFSLDVNMNFSQPPVRSLNVLQLEYSLPTARFSLDGFGKKQMQFSEMGVGYSQGERFQEDRDNAANEDGTRENNSDSLQGEAVAPREVNAPDGTESLEEKAESAEPMAAEESSLYSPHKPSEEKELETTPETDTRETSGIGELIFGAALAAPLFALSSFKTEKAKDEEILAPVPYGKPSPKSQESQGTYGNREQSKPCGSIDLILSPVSQNYQQTLTALQSRLIPGEQRASLRLENIGGLQYSLLQGGAGLTVTKEDASRTYQFGVQNNLSSGAYIHRGREDTLGSILYKHFEEKGLPLRFSGTDKQFTLVSVPGVRRKLSNELSARYGMAVAAEDISYRIVVRDKDGKEIAHATPQTILPEGSYTFDVVADVRQLSYGKTEGKTLDEINHDLLISHNGAARFGEILGSDGKAITGAYVLPELGFVSQEDSQLLESQTRAMDSKNIEYLVKATDTVENGKPRASARGYIKEITAAFQEYLAMHPSVKREELGILFMEVDRHTGAIIGEPGSGVDGLQAPAQQGKIFVPVVYEVGIDLRGARLREKPILDPSAQPGKPATTPHQVPYSPIPPLVGNN